MSSELITFIVRPPVLSLQRCPLSAVRFAAEVFCVIAVTEFCLRAYGQTLQTLDRLCGLVVRIPGYTTEMYCDSCEVRTEFIYVMYSSFAD
jgi:hypothetical protein